MFLPPHWLNPYWSTMFLEQNTQKRFQFLDLKHSRQQLCSFFKIKSKFKMLFFIYLFIFLHIFDEQNDVSVVENFDTMWRLQNQRAHCYRFFFWTLLSFAEVGVSRNPCASVYAGAAPFSEVEVAGIRDFITWKISDLKMYVSLHSYGQVVLSPWGYTTEKPENYDDQVIASDFLSHFAFCIFAISIFRWNNFSLNQLHCLDNTIFFGK